LFQAQPDELNAANLEKHGGSSDITLLIDFSAGWCGPCCQMAPSFAAAAVKVDLDLRLGKVDTKAEQALATCFAVQSIPSLVLVQRGQPITRTASARPALLQWIEDAMALRHRHLPDYPVGARS
jgi:thioredoxin 2